MQIFASSKERSQAAIACVALIVLAGAQLVLHRGVSSTLSSPALSYAAQGDSGWVQEAGLGLIAPACDSSVLPSGCGDGTLNDQCPVTPHGCGAGTLNDECVVTPSGCGAGTLNDACACPTGYSGTYPNCIAPVPHGCGIGTLNDACPPAAPHGCGVGTLNDTCVIPPALISGCGAGTLNDTCVIPTNTLPSGCGTGTLNDTCPPPPSTPSGCGAGTLNDTCPSTPTPSGCGVGTLNDECCSPSAGAWCNAGTNDCGMPGIGSIQCDGSCGSDVPSDAQCAAPTVVATSPIIVNPGATALITWSASPATNCRIAGGTDDYSGGSRGSFTTSAITASTLYTATCWTQGAYGIGPSASAIIRVILNPAFQEI